jgi:hypothetical protein
MTSERILVVVLETTAKSFAELSIIPERGPSNLLYFWEVANAHQILQSSEQRLNKKAGAVNASCAPISSRITSTSNDNSGGQSQRRQQQDDNSTIAGSLLIPLVESIKALAECQRQMGFDRVKDRKHERQLKEQCQQSEGAEQRCERAFR